MHDPETECRVRSSVIHAIVRPLVGAEHRLSRLLGTGSVVIERGIAIWNTSEAAVGPVLWNIAVVILEIIDSPFCKCLCIDLFVAKRCWIATTSE